MKEEKIEKKQKEEKIYEETSDINNNKETAAASYFLILSPVLLLTRKDSKFIQHHASQAFILFLIFIILWILGSFLSFFAWLTVGVFFMALVGFIQAISGEWYKMPYIFDIIKDGISFAGIISGIKKIYISLKKIGIGLFPQNTKNILKRKEVNEGIKNNSNTDFSHNNSDLEKRIGELEMLLSQQNFFPNFSPLKNLSADQKKEIENILSEISQKDLKAEIEKNDKFYTLTGNFGVIYIGFENGEIIKWGNI